SNNQIRTNFILRLQLRERRRVPNRIFHRHSIHKSRDRFGINARRFVISMNSLDRAPHFVHRKLRSRGRELAASSKQRAAEQRGSAKSSQRKSKSRSIGHGIPRRNHPRSSSGIYNEIE